MGFRKRLYYNTALLSASAVLMRCIGMVWQACLARRIGEAGLGLFGLIQSVDVLFITLSISGIRLAVMRLLSEELGRGRTGSVSGVMLRAGVYGMLCGLGAMGLLYTLSGPIALRWVSDARTLEPLRLLAFSFPAVGVFSVLSGYFTAVGRVWKTAAEQLGEQLFRMGLALLFLRKIAPGDIAGACLALVRADVITDNASIPVMLLIYAFDRRGQERGGTGGALTERMLRLAAPLALTAYAQSAVHTFRQIMVPKGLRLSGMGAEGALAGYGVISGMALPLLTFPLCLPSSLGEMLLPELTAAQAEGRLGELRPAVRELLRKTALVSLGLGAFFFAGADVLGGRIFRSAECGRYVRLLAPLLPLLFTNTVLFGCLRGLGEMRFSFGVSLCEGGTGLVLAWWLLPRLGLGGYVLSLYAGEAVQLLLGTRRLRRCMAC